MKETQEETKENHNKDIEKQDYQIPDAKEQAQKNYLKGKNELREMKNAGKKHFDAGKQQLEYGKKAISSNRQTISALPEYDIKFFQVCIRLGLGIISLFSIAIDIKLILELWYYKEDKEKRGFWDYQFYVMLLVTIFSALIGHCLGNQQPPDYPPPNQYLSKFLFRAFGLIGLTHIVYFFHSSIYRKGKVKYDRYCMLQMGPRRWWAHFQSVLSCFISSHFMYTSGEHTNWVVAGFILNSCNACLAFIEYTGYYNQIDEDHKECEKCKCPGNNNIHECLIGNRESYPFNLQKATCKRCKKSLKDQEQFFYCGCKNHLVNLCKDCKLQNIDHRQQSIQENFISRNYIYILMFPEIIARPLFFGATALIEISESPFTDAKPVKLTYDFFIWNTIAMASVLSLPYFAYLLISEQQNIRPASLLIFYTFYYSQILRTPYRSCKIVRYHKQIIMMEYIKTQEEQKITRFLNLKFIYDKIRKSLEFDSFNSIIDTINLPFLIQSFPYIIAFLGYFPAIWRIGEIIALAILLYINDYGNLIDGAEKKEVLTITKMTMGWNLLAFFSIIFSIYHFAKIQMRVRNVNKEWEKKEGKSFEHYKQQAQFKLQQKINDLRGTMVLSSLENQQQQDQPGKFMINQMITQIMDDPDIFPEVVHQLNQTMKRQITQKEELCTSNNNSEPDQIQKKENGVSNKNNEEQIKNFEKQSSKIENLKKISDIMQILDDQLTYNHQNQKETSLNAIKKILQNQDQQNNNNTTQFKNLFIPENQQKLEVVMSQVQNSFRKEAQQQQEIVSQDIKSFQEEELQESNNTDEHAQHVKVMDSIRNPHKSFQGQHSCR